MNKAFRIKTTEKRISECEYFVFADNKEKAIKLFNAGEMLKNTENEISTHVEVTKLHEVECHIKEEENEYTKNYPKKDERPLD